MLRPLTAPSTSTTHNQLPSLLSSLPTAPQKVLKGLTPLPKNAPRTLRRGQSAANLKRAQGRDEAAGIVAGANRSGGMGREALTLKEKRKADGDDKRERGMGSKVGKMSAGGLRISREDISKINGDSSRGSKRGGRGGARGGGSRGGRGRK